MLSVKNRFHGHSSVRRAYRQGRPTRSQFFGIHVNTDKRVHTTKFAVVVSKKIHKSAVKRNRVRRRVYELVRLLLPDINTPSEIVITVYSEELIDLPSEELRLKIVETLKKAGALNK